MDDEFKLCWKNFQDNIASGFQNLYDRGDLVDVTLACDGKLLQAHKIVLAICSPYFQEIFTTNPCQHPISEYSPSHPPPLHNALRLFMLQLLARFLHKVSLSLFTQNVLAAAASAAVFMMSPQNSPTHTYVSIVRTVCVR